MPSHFTLRMQFGPHEDPKDITRQLDQLVRAAPVDEIMLFCFAEEQNDGHDTLERVKLWLDRSRPYRDALWRAGVQVSLNPWHSMLHCDRGRSLKPGQEWQRMVDPTGREARAVVCPLDPAWQEYYRAVLGLFARERFRVVWIDDDIRYHNHGPLEWGGCFCPLHVAAFNERNGTNASREELVHACLASGAPHPWRAQWFDFWQETICALLDEWRGIIEGGGAKMGLMSSAMESHAAEGRRWAQWWQAFGGGNPPVHRPHFWGYSDAMGSMLIHGIASLDQNRSIQPAELESGPEIENFTYGQWNKSFRQTFAQMAVAHILGSTNLNISLYDFMGNRPDDEPERAAFLTRVRPAMDWLADMFPMTMRSVGAGVPWSEEMGRTMRTPRGSTWFELTCPPRGWAYWLGAAGIAFSARAQQAVNALAGPLAWSFPDEQINEWLAAGLLLDGPAAEILVKRGFGAMIGVEAARQVLQEEVLYSMEHCLDPRFALRVGAQMSVNDRPHTRALLQGALAGGAVMLTDLRDPLQRVVGHGAFIFENRLGGRVAVVPWNASAGATPEMNVHRAAQLRRVVQWLARGGSVGWAEGGAWLVPQFLTDGSAWRAAVWNAGPDEIGTFTVHLPDGMPRLRMGWHCTPAGTREPAAIDGGVIRTVRPVHQWDVVVLVP
ncbi:hypothetical protein GX586_03050 [bacterium]|nr:hypothetical protein [bacterium]